MQILSNHTPLVLVSSVLFALIFPIVLLAIKNRYLKCAFFCGYILLILYLTIISRNQGDEVKIQLTPFWSYALLNDSQYRSQIYLNILLFVPFGCLLQALFKSRLTTHLILAMALSVLIESLQYLLRIGMCEFDDVFHNVLGAAIGFEYWKLILPFERKLDSYLWTTIAFALEDWKIKIKALKNRINNWWKR